jgi:small subunit ribosomal protein S8
MSDINFQVGDFLIRLKNAALAGNKEVIFGANKEAEAIASALKDQGFLGGVKKEGKKLEVTLSFKNKRPVLMNLKLISKPGLRIYMGVAEIEKKKGPSQYILSTPKGILLSKRALKERVGGEVIAEVW